MGAKKSLAGRNYQMKITLKGIRPPIWRRVQVPGTIRLAGFHKVIQTVFGWTDSHLHQFLIDDTSYGQPDDFDDDVVTETTVTLAQAVGGSKRFTYVYDFGDNWEHDILVEKVNAGDSGSERPLCLGGKRRRPPEDCGGPWGYREFLEAIRNPRRAEHDAMLEWVGGGFDSEAFDVTAVNRALAALSVRQGRVQ